MIKTVSFAPSRTTKTASKAGSKVPAKSANTRAVSSTVPAKSSPARGQSDAPASATAPQPPRRRTAKENAPEKTPTVLDVAQVRAGLPKGATSKGASARKTRAPKTAGVEEVPATTTSTKKTPAPRVTGKAAKVEAAKAEAAVPTKPVTKKRKTSALETASAPTKSAAKASVEAAAKAKRARVPKDLALQYGAAPVAEDVARNVAEKPAPRKRRTRAEKEARTQLLTPGEELMQRLQAANAVEVKKPARRGRGWEFECGFCGRISRFQTPGALCECGAIAVRE